MINDTHCVFVVTLRRYECDSVFTEGTFVRGRDMFGDIGLMSDTAAAATQVLHGFRGSANVAGLICVGGRDCHQYPVGGSSLVSGAFSRQVETILRVQAIGDQSRFVENAL